MPTTGASSAAPSLHAPRWHQSVHLKLVLFVGLMLVLMSTAVGWSSFHLAKGILLTQITERLTDLVASRGRILSVFITQKEEQAAVLATHSRLQDLLVLRAANQIDDDTFGARAHPILLEIKANAAGFEDIAIATPDGEVIAATDQSRIGMNVSSAWYFQTGLQGTHFSPPFHELTGYRAPLATPLHRNGGELIGVALIEVDAAPMETLTAEVPRLGQSAEVILARRSEDGEVEAIFPPRMLPSAERAALADFEPIQRAVAGQAGELTTHDYRGKEVLTAFQPVGHEDWGIVAKVDVDEAYAAVRRLRLITMAVAGLLLAIALPIVYRLARRFTRPLREITATALSIATGDRDARIGLHGRTDEIGILATALRAMNHNLRTHQESLEDRVSDRTVELRAANELLEKEIDDRNVLEDELRRAKEEAEAASQAKSAFLATMSHEIRTPMNGIVGMAELLAGSQLSPVQRDYLETIQDSAESLLAVINDILDFSRIEAGKLELERQPFDLRECVGNTMRSFSERAHAKGVELATRVDPCVPTGVIGDSSRLRQIIVNLVGNALKFTDHGEILVDITCRSVSDREVELHFVVKDTGIGIPADRQRAVFQAFEQSDSSFTRRYGGTGLGLTISARLIQMMKGRVWVESEVGKGSSFFFTLFLPIAKPGAVPTAEPESALKGLRVLVVDDNPTNAKILHEVLAAWDMAPTTVTRGSQALNELRDAKLAGQAFELVLLDANMPDVDGFQLARHIIADLELGGPIIMMLSSADRPGDIARCNELGVAQYLIKPVKQSDLLEAIRYVSGVRALPFKRTTRQSATSRPLRILLAEDSAVGQRLAIELLSGAGHTVTLARNGREAVARYERQAEEGAFDIILMDVQMPEMDGLEATRFIRRLEQETGRHVPIIAMTAHAMKGDRDRCLAAGMDDYVSKPVRAKELKEAVERHRPSEQHAAPAGALATEEAPAAPLPALSPPRASIDDEAVVAWQQALDRLDGNGDLLKAMARDCLDDCPRRLVDLEEALANEDGRAARLAAHTLKGTAQAIVAPRVVECAARLESLASEDRLIEASQGFPELRELVERMLAELAGFLEPIERERPTRGASAR